MAQQIKKKFIDPELISQVDGIEQGLAQEIFDREFADQGLSAFISDVNTALGVEVGNREDADSELNLRIDALESFGYEQIVYVSKSGLDTNSGKQHSPFLTITAAQNAITDASPTKRYVIKVMSGNYTEASLALKANVFIVGEGNKESVRITGPVSMHSSFSGTGDHRSGFHRVTLLSAADFNWATVTSGAGKLYFSETVFGSTLNMYGHNNAIAQTQFNSCVIFGAFTVSGINVGVFTDNICFSNITLNQHPNGGMVTTISATGGYCGGTFRLNSTANDFNRRSSAFLRGFWSENLISDGPVSYADVDLTSGSKQGAETLNGGQVIALNPKLSHDLETKMLKPVANNAHNNGDWGKQWFFNFAYVYASSGTDMYISTVGSSYDPAGDDAGRSVFIDADGYGLKPDVNGGNVQISTASTSGTGVRGKVVLNGREVDVTNKKIINLADGIDVTDAINKGQLDDSIQNITTELLSIESGFQSQIDAEKSRIDAILLASDADKDSFAEIVSLINSVDTENDQAFANYVLSNDSVVSDLGSRVTTNEFAIQNLQQAEADLAAQVSSIENNINSINSAIEVLEAKGFSKGSTVVGTELSYIDLDREYFTILSVSVGRVSVHEGEDYIVSGVNGVTRLTWIGSLSNPDGAEKIETGDKVFWVGSF